MGIYPPSQLQVCASAHQRRVHSPSLANIDLGDEQLEVQGDFRLAVEGTTSDGDAKLDKFTCVTAHIFAGTADTLNLCQIFGPLLKFRQRI
jgi:hypothetical protein